MAPRTALVLLLVVFAIEVNIILSYKTLDQLKAKHRKIENDEFSSSDLLVGKAMDFIYSNKTVMSLIARELWDVGSRAIDRIVDMKDKIIPTMHGLDKPVTHLKSPKDEIVVQI